MISFHLTKQTVLTPLCLLTGFASTCIIPFNTSVMAQIVPDNSLGSEGSVVIPNQNIRGINSDRIDGGAVRGGNLFHSFQEFNVDVGRGAYFSNPDSIVNILTRVTGDNVSNILGTLGVLGNANLFLINPNGIVFGPNARLDVGGSFFASTADGILLENGIEFAASNPEAPPLLTINIPLGLNIRENQPAIESSTLLPPQTVLVVGEEVRISENTQVGQGNIGLILTDAGFLEGLSGERNVVVQTTNDITVADLQDNVLEFQPGSGVIMFTADAEGDGVGSFVMLENPNDLLRNGDYRDGRINTIKTNGRDISISGASLTLSNIDASGIDRSDTPISDGAGQLLNTARVISSEPGSELTTISGHISSPDNVDLFQIYIPGDGNFSVELDQARPFQLYLFNANGIGIDAGTSSLPSPNGQIPNEPGIYYLAVGNDNFDPESQEGIIFRSIFPRDISTLPLTRWQPEDGSENSQVVGNYTLNLAGVQAPEAVFIESVAATSDSGGSINLTATHGDINSANLISRSFADAENNVGNVQSGGNITLNANRGRILTGNLNSSSNVNFIGNTGAGGRINLESGNSITAQSLDSSSFSVDGSIGNGGDINLIGNNNIIVENSINSASTSGLNGNSGNGGSIILNTAQGNIRTGALDSSTKSASSRDQGEGGVINLNSAFGNITVVDSLTSGRFSFRDNGRRAGGTVVLNAGGNISTESAVLTAGTINFTAGENISTGMLPGGGEVRFTAGNDINTIMRTQDGQGGGTIGVVDFTAGGNISIGNSTGGDIPGTFPSNGTEFILRANGDITVEPPLSFRTGQGNIAFTAGGSIFSSPLSSGSFENDDQGGGIAFIAGENILITGGLDSSGTVTGGNISIEAEGDITIVDDNLFAGSGINSDNTAGGSTVIIGSDRFITDGTTFIDDGGNISILEPDSFILGNGINASGGNQGGDVTIVSQAGTINLAGLLINSSATRQGDGGNLTLSANSVNLTVTELTTIATKTGIAGNISINAPNTVFLDSSRLSTSLETGAVGRGGDVNISSGSLSLSNGSFIDTATLGIGDAGNVTIEAETVSLDLSTILSTTEGTGNIGTAGSVTVQADSFVFLTNRSNISTASGLRTQGNSGNIEISTGFLSVTGGSQLQTLTRGTGNAGRIDLNVADSTVFSGIGEDGFLSGAFTSSNTLDSGQGGSIEVKTSRFLVEDGAVLSAQTQSNAPGGDIVVNANTVVLRNGGQLRTDTLGSGRAGNITVTTTEGIFVTGIDQNFDQRLTPPPAIRENVIVTSPRTLNKVELENLVLPLIDSNFSLDSPDNINPNVEFSTRIPYVSILGNLSEEDTADTYAFEVTAGTRGFFDVDTGDSDQLPNVNTTLTLFDQDGNELQVNNDAPVRLGAEGSVVQAIGNDSLDPYMSFVFTEPGTYFIQVGSFGSISEAGTYTLNISLESPNIAGSVIETEPASGMFARTSGTGAAGNITLNTPQLSVTDGAQISTTATATANRTEPSGNLTINADQINLSSNSGLSTNIPPSSLSSETQGVAPAGTLILKPYTQPNLTVQLRDNAAISTSTSGAGAGGDLTITAPDTITLSGNGRVAAESSDLGQGGNIRIETETLRILDGINVTATSTGTGAAGSVEINSNSLELNNSTLSAETAAGDQGNIILNTNDLRLRRNSNITTNATGEATGGNIRINTDNLIAIEDSDISANAEDSFGGQVIINADALFGTLFRPQQTNASDITATSELGPDFSGTVEINNEIDPARGLVDLSTTVVDPAALIAQDPCKLRGDSEFIITGRGGIASSPNDIFTGDRTQVSLVEPVEPVRSTQNRSTSTQRPRTEPSQPRSSADIIPARGWIRDENGDVILVSYDPTKTGVRRQPVQLPQCQP